MTKILKLARQREIVETGMDTLLDNARIGPEQRKGAEKVKADLAAAVPWTVDDAIKLQGAKPGTTLRDLGVGETRKKDQPAGSAPIPPAQGAAAQPNEPQPQANFTPPAGTPDTFTDPTAPFLNPGQPAPAQGGMPPPQAVAKLKEGVQTRFSNGQVWTLRDGKPERVN